MQKHWHLQQLDLFQGIPDEKIMSIAKKMIEKRCAKKEIIYIPNEANVKILYFLTSFPMIKNIILIGIIALGLAGCSQAIEKTQDPISEKPKTVSEVKDTNTKQEPIKGVIAESDQVALYTDFTQERYSELLGKKPFAIFFHAPWCSDCVNLEKQIKKNIEDLPKETVILKADYDTESKLKQDYGIIVQSTVVVIDKSGDPATTLLGPSFDNLKTAIENSL